jgi:hypothetical protein
VVILVIDKICILAFEPERETPISAHSDGPMSLQVTSQWMQVIARRIHISGAGSRIQRKKKFSQSICMFWLNASLRAGFGKELYAFVSIALDHP